MLSLRADHVADWVRATAPGLNTAGTPAVRPVEESSDSQEALETLGGVLSNLAERRADIPGNLSTDRRGEHLAAIMAQLGTARAMRLLGWLAMEDVRGGPEIAHALLAGTFGNPEPLRAMVNALHRKELLDRMFSEDRLEQLLLAIKSANHGDVP